MIRTVFLWLALAGFLPGITALGGCASLALEAPRTFNEHAAYTIASITALRTAATGALIAKTISADDAENVQALANRARSSVDAARALQALGNAPDAMAQLVLAEGILTQLRTYLTTKGIKTP